MIDKSDKKENESLSSIDLKNNLNEIGLALKNSNSENQESRKKSFEILSHFESNPDFLQVLILILSSSNDTDLLYKSLIYMKNTISRRWKSSSRQLANTEQSLSISNATKNMAKQFVIQALGANLNLNFFNQILEILSLISHQEFPGNWPEMSQLLLEFLDNIAIEIKEKSAQDISIIINSKLNYLKVLKNVMKEQMKKKILPVKVQFYKIANDFMSKVYIVFNIIICSLEYEYKVLDFSKDFSKLIKFSTIFDKILIDTMQCSFKYSDLLLSGDCLSQQIIKFVGIFINNKTGLIMKIIDSSYSAYSQTKEVQAPHNLNFN